MNRQLLSHTPRFLAISTLRFWVQMAFLVFTLWIGYRFYRFYLWAIGQSEVFVPRSPGVEGFLPISALLSLKGLILTGEYDSIHPAGLTIFLAALVIGFFLRKGFCGWICPVGAASNLLERVARKARILVDVPFWLHGPLLSLKYLLLFFFLYAILWAMDLNAVVAFRNTPYNLAADAKMLLFFTDPSRLAAGVTFFLILLSFFIRNFWCRYLCPYGGLLGLLALFGPFQVRRDQDLCIDCGKCDRICPAAIRVSGQETVMSPECIGCMECVAVCPKKSCLSVGISRKVTIPPHALALAVVAVFLLFYGLATLSGHWQSQVPTEVFQEVYRLADRMGHS